jgi:hypothetical protein
VAGTAAREADEGGIREEGERRNETATNKLDLRSVDGEEKDLYSSSGGVLGRKAQ